MKSKHFLFLICFVIFSVSQLEFPTPERLLPIGQHAKMANTLADKVREVLTSADISHLKQESSFERSESTGNEMTQSSQTNSPRRLTKQIAMESPTEHHQTMNARNRAGAHSPVVTIAGRREETMMTQRQRLRKMGPFAVDSQSIPDSRTKYAGAWPPSYDSDSEAGCPSQANSKQNADTKPPNREERICHRCSECGVEIEEYSDEEIGIMIIILNTFIHREPALAATFLPEILTTVSK